MVMFTPKIMNSNNYEWLTTLKQPSSQRQDIQQVGEFIQYNQIAWQILGSTTDVDEYFENLYDLTHDEYLNICLLSEELDKNISNEMFQDIQKILSINTAEHGLSVNRLIAFLEGSQLIPKHENQDIHLHIRNQIKTVLTKFKDSNTNGFLDNNFRRVLVDLVKWLHNHIKKWLENDFPRNSPLILWYGDMTFSESYFLYLLILIGFDVVIFHPEGKDMLSILTGENDGSTIYTLPATTPLVPFPKTKPARKETVAHKASKEIERLIHTDDSLLFKPWQFRNYATRSITLKTTYDELFILHKERAMLRPNFEVKNNIVQIPVFFSKIVGVPKNRREYWEKVEQLTYHEITHTIDHLPFTNFIKGNNQYHYQNALGQDGILDPQKMMESNWWKYKELPNGLQFGLALAIARYVENVVIKPLANEAKQQTQLFLFNQVMNIPVEILRLLQQFDYTQQVPKLLIYNTEQNGTLSRSDAALLLLLNEFGIDIILLNPTGQNDIEMFIEEKYFDTHWLDEVSFDQEFQELKVHGQSILKRVIKKLF
ncbi:YceG family protein [Bacillus sp. RG28]|uniref:YceG family protein n=1 Tax=Gottfriedia endophytica TaxID=2820819 RepID=A0A940NQ10_9BACI|nr:YceG family protein [Gottfriedia endophytica]MBP0726696.1 YceG family protein [Gottfriedia endophytica]